MSKSKKIILTATIALCLLIVIGSPFSLFISSNSEIYLPEVDVKECLGADKKIQFAKPGKVCCNIDKFRLKNDKNTKKLNFQCGPVEEDNKIEISKSLDGVLVNDNSNSKGTIEFLVPPSDLKQLVLFARNSVSQDGSPSVVDQKFNNKKNKKVFFNNSGKSKKPGWYLLGIVKEAKGNFVAFSKNKRFVVKLADNIKFLNNDNSDGLLRLEAILPRGPSSVEFVLVGTHSDGSKSSHYSFLGNAPINQSAQAEKDSNDNQSISGKVPGDASKNILSRDAKDSVPVTSFFWGDSDNQDPFDPGSICPPGAVLIKDDFNFCPNPGGCFVCDFGEILPIIREECEHEPFASPNNNCNANGKYTHPMSVVINEISLPIGGTNNDYFIELRNLSSSDINLHNHSLNLIQTYLVESFEHFGIVYPGTTFNRAKIELPDTILSEGQIFTICDYNNSDPKCNLRADVLTFKSITELSGFSNFTMRLTGPQFEDTFSFMSNQFYIFPETSADPQNFELNNGINQPGFSIGRRPNSLDTNDNSQDFVTMNSSLGEDNITLNGSGSQIDPYQITNCEELQKMSNNLSSHYILTNNIDCSDTINWNSGNGFQPVGNTTNVFQGSLNGQNFTIDKLFINRVGIATFNDYVGLFGKFSGSVSNVNLTNVDITAGDGLGFGTLAGEVLGGSVTNCSATGILKSTTASYPFGGLIGYASGANIDTSFAFVEVKGGYVCNGGFIGSATGNTQIANSFARGSVSGPQSSGGFAGCLGSVQVSNCYATGSVDVTTAIDYTTAGFYAFGDEDNSVVTNSFASGVPTRGDGFGPYGAALEGNNYYDRTRTTAYDSGCYYELDCLAVNTLENPEPDYFFENSIKPPLNVWDFTNVWKTCPGDYPVHKGDDCQIIGSCLNANESGSCFTLLWQDVPYAKPDQYYHPRVVFKDSEIVPDNSTESASEWCRNVPGKNYNYGTSHLLGDNPQGDRSRWNGETWEKLPTPSDYPRYYLCSTEKEKVVINEIYMPIGEDGSNDFIELKNLSKVRIDLSENFLNFNMHVDPDDIDPVGITIPMYEIDLTGFSIEPDGLFVICNIDNNNPKCNLKPVFEGGLFGINFFRVITNLIPYPNDTPTSISLTGSNFKDAFSFENVLASEFEDAPANSSDFELNFGINQPGFSIGRRPNSIDTNDNSQDFVSMNSSIGEENYLFLEDNSFTVLWQDVPYANSDQYYNPRVVFTNSEIVPDNSVASATEWCRNVPGKNYTYGTSHLGGENPQGDRSHWNGETWELLPTPSDYPRYYNCGPGSGSGGGSGSASGSALGSGKQGSSGTGYINLF